MPEARRSTKIVCGRLHVEAAEERDDRVDARVEVASSTPVT